MSKIVYINMSLLARTGFSLIKNAALSSTVRTISITKQLNLKEMREQKEGSTLIVEGVTIPSPRTELLIRAENIKDLVQPEGTPAQTCYMCALDLDVKHTDVLILSQFVRTDGCMLPRRVTRLCLRQQKKIGKMVSMAQKAGLMINLTPSPCKKDPKQRYGSKKFNTYFDETTIFLKNVPKPLDHIKKRRTMHYQEKM